VNGAGLPRHIVLSFATEPIAVASKLRTIKSIRTDNLVVNIIFHVQMPSLNNSAIAFKECAETSTPKLSSKLK
jgi:hypothetical protein